MTWVQDLQQSLDMMRPAPSVLHVPLLYAQLVAHEIDPALIIETTDELHVRRYSDNRVVTLVAH